MKRLVRVVLLGAALVAVTWWGGPHLLRHVGFFRVRQVELVGMRYLAPQAVLAALALKPDRSLFDDNGPVAERAAAIPGVVSASVSRRLPATLRIALVERVPVAFAPGLAGMVALDAESRPLPYDPTVGALDLPVVPRPDEVLVRTLAVVRAVDAALYGEVDAARRGRGQTVILQLGSRQVLLKAIPTVSDVRALEAVRRHLVETGRPYTELDARFAGWIIVRRGRV